MNRKATTKDELFLLKLYELACKAGSEDAEINQYVVGRAIGQNDKGAATIARHLAQANFVKKGDQEGSYYLTPQGLHLCLSLRTYLGSTIVD